MTLIKCVECGLEISTEAKTCPHCGIKNSLIENSKNIRPLWDKAILLLFLFLILSGFYFGIKKLVPSVFKDGISPPQQQTISGRAVPLQEVKNLGYVFYLGQIDNTNNITDNLKNQITKIVYNAHFPKDMLKNIPIIILNNLSLTGDQYIPTPAGNLKVPDLKADFLSEGGIYVTFSSGSAIIFINKPIIAQGLLAEVLTHELGHAIGSKLTDKDWLKFYQLRNIPTGTPRMGTNWNLSPAEDFAEVYKNTFTGIEVKTYYGQLIPNLGIEMHCMITYQDAEASYYPKIDSSDTNAWINSITKPIKIDYETIKLQTNANPKVQGCRRDVLLNPSKYSSDWQYGTPYKTIVNQVTKNFVIGITK